MKNKKLYIIKLKECMSNLVKSQKQIKTALKEKQTNETQSEYDKLKHQTAAVITHLHYLIDPIKREKPSFSKVRKHSDNVIHGVLYDIYDTLLDEKTFKETIEKHNVRSFIVRLPIVVKGFQSNELVDVHLTRDEMIDTFGYDKHQLKYKEEYREKGLYLDFDYIAEKKEDDKRVGVYIVTKHYIPNAKDNVTDTSRIVTG